MQIDKTYQYVGPIARWRGKTGVLIHISERFFEFFDTESGQTVIAPANPQHWQLFT